MARLGVIIAIVVVLAVLGYLAFVGIVWFITHPTEAFLVHTAIIFGFAYWRSRSFRKKVDKLFAY